jgi:hypothetical protein
VSRCGQGQIVHCSRDRRDPRKEKRRLMTPEDMTPRIVLELNAVFCLDAIDRLK